MQTINFNRVPLAATHPLVPAEVASTGMSLTTRMLSALALIFFSTLIYFAARFKSSSSSDNNQTSKEDNDIPPPSYNSIHPNQEAQLIADIICLREAMNKYQGDVQDTDLHEIISLNGEDCPFNQETKESLIKFVASLSIAHPNIQISPKAQSLIGTAATSSHLDVPLDQSPPPYSPPAPPNTNVAALTLKDEIIVLRQALLMYQEKDGVDYEKLFSLVDANLLQTDVSKGNLVNFLVELKSKYPDITISQEAQLLIRESESKLIKSQNDELEEALRIDQEKEAALQKEARFKEVAATKDQAVEATFVSLMERLAQATVVLEERTRELAPVRKCVESYCRQKNAAQGQPIQINVAALEKQKGVDATHLEELKKTVTDEFMAEIQAFNEEYSEERFKEQREKLNEQYKLYEAKIEPLNDLLEWGRIRNELIATFSVGKLSGKRSTEG